MSTQPVEAGSPAPDEQAATAGSEQLPAALGVLLDQMDNRAHAELLPAVSLKLFPPETAAQRWRRLIGPLAEMVRPHVPTLDVLLADSGDPPSGPRAPADVRVHVPARHIPTTREEYDLNRPVGAPTSHWLVDEYGSWAVALEVAAGLRADGRYVGKRAPVGSVLRGKPRKPRFDQHEHLAAIRQCALSIGRKPSWDRYLLWSRVQRALARDAGPEAIAALRLPDWGSFKRHFRGGWAEAVRRTVIDPDELARTRARLLPSVAPEDIDDPSVTAREVLATLDPADLADLGLTPAHVRKMAAGNRGGFLALPLSTAAALAARLEGSLTWLAELGNDPGVACDPTLRFDGDRVRDARQRAGLQEGALMRRAGFTLAQWRGLIAGRAEPDLRTVKLIADQVGVRCEELCG